MISDIPSPSPHDRRLHRRPRRADQVDVAVDLAGTRRPGQHLLVSLGVPRVDDRRGPVTPADRTWAPALTSTPRQGPQGTCHAADRRHPRRAARLAERAPRRTECATLSSRQGRSLSRDAIERRISHYALLATERCPSLNDKTVTAHVLRHTTAMRLLHAGVDTSVIALWLGHVSIETTQIYLHADMTPRRRHWREPDHRTPGTADTDRLPPCSPGSTGSDYADLASAEPCPARESAATSA